MTASKPEQPRGPIHDPGYKHLYSHAAMVRDLLTGFIDADWVAELDLDTLERCPGSYVSDDLRERADDILRRVRWRDAWLHLYLLLEFQSGIDPWMAVRIAIYVGLLYQDLIRTKRLAADGTLPPVVPIVLYNGEPPWSAELAVEPLYHAVAPPLASFRLAQRYPVLDEIRIAERGNLPQRNLLKRLIRRRFGSEVEAGSAELLEQISDPLTLEDLGERLLDSAGPEAWLAALEQAAKRATRTGEGPPSGAPEAAPSSH